MKRLYRIKSQAKIGGVCAGLGEYLNLDPTLIRLIFIILLFSGPGLLIYLAMWIAIPDISKETTGFSSTISEHPEEMPEQKEFDESYPNAPAPSNTSRSGMGLGLILVILGGLFLIKNFGYDLFYWMHWFNWRTFWPLILVGLGIYILYQNKK